MIPLASDLLSCWRHIWRRCTWFSRRRAFWSGALAGVAFWINPKGLIVAAACAVWFLGGIPLMLAGFAAASAVILSWLVGHWHGAAAAYWDEVWRWGRVYAASPFVENPLRNGAVRTAGWFGFHAALAVGAVWFLVKHKASLPDVAAGGNARPTLKIGKFQWIGWLLLALIGVAAGMRFFPRYYFLLLPAMVLMAARGFTVLGRRGEYLALLLILAPLLRFAPGYLFAIRNAEWRDTAMDRDSRTAAQLVRSLARPGDTLFVWGYRPELYTYTGLPAGTIYLDSQMLSGVPADRHLTQSEPVEQRAPPRAGRRWRTPTRRSWWMAWARIIRAWRSAATAIYRPGWPITGQWGEPLKPSFTKGSADKLRPMSVVRRFASIIPRLKRCWPKSRKSADQLLLKTEGLMAQRDTLEAERNDPVKHCQRLDGELQGAHSRDPQRGHSASGFWRARTLTNASVTNCAPTATESRNSSPSAWIWSCGFANNWRRSTAFSTNLSIATHA